MTVMTGIPSSPLSVSKCTDNNIDNQPTTWLMCIHVYYAGSGSTRHVEHPESAETEPLSPKSNRSGISLAFWALRFPSLAALFVLCSIEGKLLSPLRTHRASTLLYLCPVAYSHTLFVLCSIEALSVGLRDSARAPSPHACIARISPRSSQHACLTRIPFAILTATQTNQPASG